MRIRVHVKPNSSKKEIKQISDKEYSIKLHSSPEKGKANEELLKVLSEYFHVPQKKIIILKGEFSRQKIIELEI
ncbi:MAG: DUF167 domain-containing protein [Leptonema sp. (in: bacteria)]